MRIELRPFQEAAALELMSHLDDARREVTARGRPQALVLSAPTGSGKTVIMTALIERVLHGFESYEADEDAVFLWLSDSPELNRQSRDKIVRQSSKLLKRDLVMVESPFSQRCFEAGKVYFLNTQKLSKDRLLTKHANKHNYTIWQTIDNTSRANAGRFYVIVDEAHRGMTESRASRELAITIVQRFIKGYPEGGMQPVKLIIGMSATPERFNRTIEGSGRTIRAHQISPDDVRDSGLLKDRIVVFHPTTRQPADTSLLAGAAKQWMRFKKEWSAYCMSQKLARPVEPVLVIQVEDAGGNSPSKTDLDKLVEVVERTVGRLPDSAWAHAFQEDSPLVVGGKKVRKVDASQIEYESSIQVVLFKMSLTTGWDCPRAEVMMSFRKAKDPTFIAQLIGRMVRTPLARAVEGQDFLNSVSLYLPHYDREGVDAILAKLNSPDPDVSPPTTAVDGSTLSQYDRDGSKGELFGVLEELPSYRVERIAKMSNVRRVMRLARLLRDDEIDSTAVSYAKALVLRVLAEELARLRRSKSFKGDVAAGQDIEVREVWVERGELKEPPSSRALKVKATPENINDIFVAWGRRLGEGLHMEYWKSRKNLENPDQAKLELHGILMDKKVWHRLEEDTGECVQQWLRKHAPAIRALVSGRREEYDQVRSSARKPEPGTLTFPPSIEVPKEIPLWEGHVYVDRQGKYGAKLNKWERETIETEIARKGFLGWFRNLDRKPWSLCVPYKVGNDDHPLYPDFVVFRSNGDGPSVSLLDPHDPSHTDAVDKAKGLAQYAADHGEMYDRIELIRRGDDGRLERLDVNKESIRREVLDVANPAQLVKLYAKRGSDR